MSTHPNDAALAEAFRLIDAEIEAQRGSVAMWESEARKARQALELAERARRTLEALATRAKLAGETPEGVPGPPT